MSEKADHLRNRILALAESYFLEAFPQQKFVAWSSPVPVSGKVLDPGDLRNLMDSALDCWLTTGRFAAEFERQFARYFEVNHSVVPLRIATLIGCVVSFVTLMATVGYLVAKLVMGKAWPPGFTTLVILILGSLSLNALFLGIIGEYLGRIYRQVKKRSLTIIESEINSLSKMPAEKEIESWK